jgi:hypothetical protein
VASTKTIPLGFFPGDLVIAHLNADRYPDIAVGGAENNPVKILLGHGKGDLTVVPNFPYHFGNKTNNLCFADFNGDGFHDFAVVKYSETASKTFPGSSPGQSGTSAIRYRKLLAVNIADGHGGFLPQLKPTVSVDSRLASQPTDIVGTGDFNGDGLLDLLVEGWVGEEMAILLGDGDGGFSRPAIPLTFKKEAGEKIQLADINNDGRVDIFLLGEKINIWIGDGNGGFSLSHASPVSAGKAPSYVAISDVDGDKRQDLVVANWSGNPKQLNESAITVLLGNQWGGFKPMKGSPFLVGNGSACLAVGDVDGDRIPDIVCANESSEEITVLKGDGKTFHWAATIPLDHKPSSIALGDLNGDGRADIVVACRSASNLTILLSK